MANAFDKSTRSHLFRSAVRAQTADGTRKRMKLSALRRMHLGATVSAMMIHYENQTGRR